MQTFLLFPLLLAVKKIVSVNAVCNLPSTGTHDITTSCVTTKTVIPDNHLSVSGQSIEQTIITANDRSLHMFSVPDFCSLILNDLTLSGGSVMPGDASGVSLIKLSKSATLLKATNVKFMHGSANIGGAIYGNEQDDRTILVSCIFYRNVASHGGAFFGNIKAVSCTFQENTATIGGALFYGHNHRLFINSSTFDRNTATYQGGVAYADTAQGPFGQTTPKKSIQLFLHNVTVKDNSAPFGGVVYLSGFDSGITVTKSTFLRNKATSKGGVFFASGQIKIKQSQIIDSSCTVPDSLVPNEAGQGGAIFVADGTVVLDDVWITGSTVSGRGGAIYTRPGTDLSVSKSTFIGNTAAEGSAIFNEGALRIRSSFILQNRIAPSLLKAPVIVAGCKASNPCAIGRTDCNMDGDCEQGLICYQRQGDPSKKYRVPGVELRNPANVVCSISNPCSATTGNDRICYEGFCDLVPFNWGICTSDPETFASALCSRTAATGNIVWVFNRVQAHLVKV